MKQRLFTLLLALLCIATNSWADEVEIDGIHYYLVPYYYTARVTTGPDKYTGNVEIPQSVTYKYKTYNVTSIDNRAFYECRSLTSVNIPESVEYIGDGAFYECRSLTSVNIPEGVTTIGKKAFAYCSSLTSINIPGSVTRIEPEAFADCSHLTAINLSGYNANYRSVDGVLYNKNKTEILQYPAGKSDKTFIIPNSVKFINDRVFEGCINLTSINIPERLEYIDTSAFRYCI